MALTGTLDKTQYDPGNTMTLTVHRAVAERPVTVTITEADGATATVTAEVREPLTVSDPDRTWAVKSDDGSTAVYTSTA